MGVTSRSPACRVALLTTLVAGLVVAAALCTAVWAPGSLDLSTLPATTGHTIVGWVAPDGPAWSAGVRPGDTVVGRALRRRAPTGVVVRAGGQYVALGRAATAVAPQDLLDAGLGLCLLLLGSIVLVKSYDRAAASAFWLMSLLAGVTLGLIPAGFHGALWAIILSFVTLKLFGPALFALALAFPGTGAQRRLQPLFWLPALVLLLLYPFCWWRPVPLFSPVQVAGYGLLAAYILAACMRIVRMACHPTSPQQRTQLRYLAVGLVFGFGPFVLLSLLPLIIVGREVAPAQASILTLGLLPLSVGVAIVRAELLGITSLVHRRTLHAALTNLLVAAFAAAMDLLAAFAQRWGWPTPSIVAGAAALTALTFTPLQRRLTRCAERIFLRDAYDTPTTLLQLSVDLAQAVLHEVGPLVVTRLSTVLDLSFALLRTAHDPQPWFHAHPRSAVPQALQEAVAQRAQELLAVPAPADTFVDKVRHLPILFLPIWDGHQTPAVLCLGPKRSGDRYTPQDRALLGTLARQLAVIFANHRLRAQLDEQIAALHELAEERRVLAERVLSTAEQERRRLAGVLHDEAIQLGGEVVRRLNDLLAQPDLPLDSHMGLAATASLGNDLVMRLREIVADLYPPPLQMVGLLPALHALLHDAERHGLLTCTLGVEPVLQDRRLAHEHELALYQIAREAICNAVHHARASALHVTLRREGAHLCLAVSDNGVGFTLQPAGALLAAGHLGLALLGQRVRDLGGMLEIATSPGSGTTIAVRVPVPKADTEDTCT